MRGDRGHELVNDVGEECSERATEPIANKGDVVRVLDGIAPQRVLQL